MANTSSTSYEQIAGIIEQVRQHFREVPHAAALASFLHRTPVELDRLFRTWGGMDAEAFLRTLGRGHAQRLLGAEDGEATLFTEVEGTGHPAVGPTHDTFMRIEPMTEADRVHGGAALRIRYGFHATPFGRLLLAATGTGICHAAFKATDAEALAELYARFPKAAFTEGPDAHQAAAMAVFRSHWAAMPPVVLHMHGTDFQFRVWHSLLGIPLGALTTYRRIATELGMPQAARAVGTAIGSNPIAWLVPCHRVVRTSGELGGYMWGPVRKAAIMAWEAARVAGPAVPARL